MPAPSLIASLPFFLMGLVCLALVAAAGCVIPVPLQEESTPVVDWAPSIKSGVPAFNMGPFSPPSDGRFSFAVTVYDQAPDDTVSAALFILDGQVLDFNRAITLIADPDDLTLRKGETDSVKWCASVPAGEQVWFYVFVTNVSTGIPDTIDLSKIDTTRFDFKSWVISC